jgi:hypothetical protein
MTQAKTEHGDLLFKVSEYGDGTFWISTEPRNKGIPALNDALLGFGLPDGTSFQKAHEVADYLNGNLTSVSLTIFDSHPLFSK